MNLDPTFVAGSGLLAQLERPQVVAKFPRDHHEAYWFYGYDDSSGIGWYFYLLADLADATLRHERAYLTLPDGTLLAAEGQGRRSHGTVAAADGFECECIVPFFRWGLRYRASMQRIPADNRLSGAHVGEPVGVELAFDACAATAAWNVEGDWGEPPPSLRYHQLCRIAGDLRIGDTTTGIRGTAFRSHSRRLRDLSGFSGHSLANALFASGRAFGFMRFLDVNAGTACGRGFVVQEDGRMVDADVLVTPMLESAHARGEQVRIELRSELGTALVTGETTACAFKTFSGGSRRLGLHPSSVPGFVLASAWVTYQWDGERAGGVLERATTLAKASAFA